MTRLQHIGAWIAEDNEYGKAYRREITVFFFVIIFSVFVFGFVLGTHVHHLP